MADYAIRTPQQLGPVLQGYRKTRCLTQADVGQSTGLPQSAISKLEADPSSAALGRIFKLLSALDLELTVRPRNREQRSTEW
jgi:HTH-type transcriptional regulator/antitoxin HipB